MIYAACQDPESFYRLPIRNDSTQAKDSSKEFPIRTKGGRSAHLVQRFTRFQHWSHWVVASVFLTLVPIICAPPPRPPTDGWKRRLAAGCLVAGLASAGPVHAQTGPGCVGCHENQRLGPDDVHLGLGCVQCHGGAASQANASAAHRGMLVHPGDARSAGPACGGCHPERVASVATSLMYTGRGIVSRTRQILGEPAAPRGSGGFANLGDTPVDSLLRRLCAGCHLGRETNPLVPAANGEYRRGGCLACHLQTAEPRIGHPVLTGRVGDERCFDCHSRSSRISLNYAGLAEIDPGGVTSPVSALYLADGRLVERKAEDVHHRAGMACIDCHTASGLMGEAGQVCLQKEAAVDIACVDCHDNHNPRVRQADWPVRHLDGRRRIPFAATPGQEFLVTGRRGTPLWHIELRPDGAFLHRKIQGGVIRIPPYRADRHPRREAHARLSCPACHSQWAPQCYGCHSGFSPEGRQWDHLDQRLAPGRWTEERWRIRNTLPPLGVSADDRITPFVPGMILTVEHPAWPTPRFRRVFASIAPHTSGRSRTCRSCHRSPTALGLGEGHLHRAEGRTVFEPDLQTLSDGLPADAWTRLDGARSGQSTAPGNRPFRPEEIQRILDAPMPAAGPP